jgi:hypothetical protein
MKRFPTAATLAFVALIGCGGSEEDNFKLVKVTGTITKNGKPLADANVAFIPGTGNQNSTPGIDHSGPNGNYLLTFKGRTGVAPGKYKVIIEPSVELPGGGKVPVELQKNPVMFEIAKRARANRHEAAATTAKQAGVKSEFDAEVEDQAVGVTLDFDIKSS